MNESKSVLRWSVVAIATGVPVNAGVRRVSGLYLFSGVRPSSSAAALEAGETGSSSDAFGVDTLLLPRTAALRLDRCSRLARLERFTFGLVALFCAAFFCKVQGLGAFVESDGLVVIEAEHYQDTTVASAHSWVSTNTPAGFVGAAAMLAAPNTGANISTGITNTSPGLIYPIQFTRTGTYRVWIRGWAASGSDDSVYLGVDGQVVRALSYGQTGAWTWMGSPVSITNSGLHQINLWMREDGAYVD